MGSVTLISAIDRSELLPKVFPVILHRKKAVSAFFHDPGRDRFPAENCIFGNDHPLRVNRLRKRSASGISRPLPREDVSPTDCSGAAQKAERTCPALPPASLLPRSVLPSIAIRRRSGSTSPASGAPVVNRLNAAAIASGSGTPEVSVSVAWHGDLRRFTAILSRRRPGRSSCLRDKPRPAWNAAFIPLRPPGIDNRIRPDIASSGRCCMETDWPGPHPARDGFQAVRSKSGRPGPVIRLSTRTPIPAPVF